MCVGPSKALVCPARVPVAGLEKRGFCPSCVSALTVLARTDYWSASDAAFSTFRFPATAIAFGFDGLGGTVAHPVRHGSKH